MKFTMEQIQNLGLTELGLKKGHFPHLTKLLHSEQGYYLIYKSIILKVELDHLPDEQPNGFYYKLVDMEYEFYFGTSPILSLRRIDEVPEDTKIYQIEEQKEVSIVEDKKESTWEWWMLPGMFWGGVYFLMISFVYLILIAIPVGLVIIVLLAITNG